MTRPSRLLPRIFPLIAALTLTAGAAAPNLPDAAKLIAAAERDWALAVEKQAGEQRQGRYVWTDTWVLRNGHWQIVAAD